MNENNQKPEKKEEPVKKEDAPAILEVNVHDAIKPKDLGPGQRQ